MVALSLAGVRVTLLRDGVTELITTVQNQDGNGLI